MENNNFINILNNENLRKAYYLYNFLILIFIYFYYIIKNNLLYKKKNVVKGEISSNEIFKKRI